MDDLFPSADEGFEDWTRQLAVLSPSTVRVRRAEPTPTDARWMRWIQWSIPSFFVHSLDDNVDEINSRIVLLAEMSESMVGFCVAAVGHYRSDHLFIRRVGVVPPARRCEVGIALLRAATEVEPEMNIAGATLPDDVATHALNAKLATLLGSEVRKVPRSHFTPTDLGMRREEHHRPWMIERHPSSISD